MYIICKTILGRKIVIKRTNPASVSAWENITIRLEYSALPRKTHKFLQNRRAKLKHHHYSNNNGYYYSCNQRNTRQLSTEIQAILKHQCTVYINVCNHLWILLFDKCYDQKIVKDDTVKFCTNKNSKQKWVQIGNLTYIRAQKKNWKEHPPDMGPEMGLDQLWNEVTYLYQNPDWIQGKWSHLPLWPYKTACVSVRKSILVTTDSFNLTQKGMHPTSAARIRS